jgi:hypothetical protein
MNTASPTRKLIVLVTVLISLAALAAWRFHTVANAQSSVVYDAVEDFSITQNPTSACVAPPSGLVTWYRAEDNADDALGTHNAAMNGGATYAVGKVGQAFSFSSANVGAVLTPEINLGTAYTIEFWVQPTGTNNSNYHTLLYRYNRHVDSNFSGIYYRNRSSTEQKFISFDDLAYSPNNSVLPDQWYHIAVTHNVVNNSSPRRIYINGIHVASEFGTIFANFRTGLRIGGQVFTPFNGKIDEVSLYNRVLTPEEIASIAGAGGAGKCGGGGTPAAPDIALAVTGTPQTATELQEVEYRVSAINNGAQTLGGVQITHALDRRAEYLRATEGCLLSNNTVTCTLRDPLAPGASGNVSITVRYLAAASVPARFDTPALADEQDTANNTATTTTTITRKPTPANDDIAAAETISGAAGTRTGSNVGATEESPFPRTNGNPFNCTRQPCVEPLHNGDVRGRSVWYKWTAPYTGIVEMNTTANDFDTILALYRVASSGNKLSDLAGNNDGYKQTSPLYSNGASRFSYRVQSGSTYHIAVTGASVRGVSMSGAFSLQWRMEGQVIPQTVSHGITNLSPEFVNLAETNVGNFFSLTVRGNGFVSGSQVYLDGQPIAGGSTQFVSATELRASIPGDLVSTIKTINVSVVNGSARSDSRMFNVVRLAKQQTPEEWTDNFFLTPSAIITAVRLGIVVTAGSQPINTTLFESDRSNIRLPAPGQPLGAPFGAPVTNGNGGTLLEKDGNKAVLTGSLKLNNTVGAIRTTDGIVIAPNNLNVVAIKGQKLIGNDGGTLVAAGGLNLVAAGGGNLVAAGGGNIRSTGFSSVKSDSSTDNSGASYYVVKSSGSARPAFTVTTDEEGNTQIEFAATFDDTSSPKITELAETLFLLVADTPTVNLDTRAISVRENGGSVAFTLTRSGDASAPARVLYQTADGTATAGTDYTAVSGTLDFAAGETMKTITIPILYDPAEETSETFFLNLSGDPNAPDDLAFDPAQAQVTITDVPPPVALTPAADTWVQGADAFRNTNYGLTAEMQVKRTLNPGAGRGRRGFLRFDTASVAGEVTRARLRIYARLTDANLPATPMIVQKVIDTAWSETAMTWNNQPAVESFNALSQIVVAGASGQYYEFDLTDFIRAERAAGRTAISFRLINVDRTGIGGASFTSVNSKEASENRPQLVIEQ